VVDRASDGRKISRWISDLPATEKLKQERNNYQFLPVSGNLTSPKIHFKCSVPFGREGNRDLPMNDQKSLAVWYLNDVLSALVKRLLSHFSLREKK